MDMHTYIPNIGIVFSATMSENFDGVPGGAFIDTIVVALFYGLIRHPNNYCLMLELFYLVGKLINDTRKEWQETHHQRT